MHSLDNDPWIYVDSHGLSRQEESRAGMGSDSL